MGRINNTIYFCPFVLPGEVVSITSQTKKKHYVEAVPKHIIEASKKGLCQHAITSHNVVDVTTSTLIIMNNFTSKKIS